MPLKMQMHWRNCCSRIVYALIAERVKASFCCRKREYELKELREQLSECQVEATEKLNKTIEQVRGGVQLDW